MLPNELNYLINKEQHKDRLRRLERERLVQMIRHQQYTNPKLHRRTVAWVGEQMVRWGLALQRYGPHPQGASKAAIATRVR